MIKLRAILRKYAFLMGLSGVLAMTIACTGPRSVAKKRRKVRMPCPCNLYFRFPVYLAYASQKECESSTGLEWAYWHHHNNRGVCRWTDR